MKLTGIVYKLEGLKNMENKENMDGQNFVFI